MAKPMISIAEAMTGLKPQKLPRILSDDEMISRRLGAFVVATSWLMVLACSIAIVIDWHADRAVWVGLFFFAISVFNSTWKYGEPKEEESE